MQDLNFSFLDYLHQQLKDTKNLRPNSYTKQLLDGDIKFIAQKVIEEAGETSLAAVTLDDNLVCEFADLFYHVLVLMLKSNTNIDEVIAELKRRNQKVD